MNYPPTMFRAFIRTRSRDRDYTWLHAPGSHRAPVEWWTTDITPKSLMGSPLGIAMPGTGGPSAYLSRIQGAREDLIGTQIVYDIALEPTVEANSRHERLLTASEVQGLWWRWAAIALGEQSDLGPAIDRAMAGSAEPRGVTVDVLIDSGDVDAGVLLASLADGGSPPSLNGDEQCFAWIGDQEPLAHEVLGRALDSPLAVAWSELVDAEMVDAGEVTPEITWIVPGEGKSVHRLQAESEIAGTPPKAHAPRGAARSRTSWVVWATITLVLLLVLPWLGG